MLGSDLIKNGLMYSVSSEDLYKSVLRPRLKLERHGEKKPYEDGYIPEPGSYYIHNFFRVNYYGLCKIEKILKGTQSVMTSEPHCKDDNARFTPVPLKCQSIYKFGLSVCLFVFNKRQNG